MSDLKNRVTRLEDYIAQKTKDSNRLASDELLHTIHMIMEEYFPEHAWNFMDENERRKAQRKEYQEGQYNIWYEVVDLCHQVAREERKRLDSK